MPTKTLLLIDTHALAHRAFHAFPVDLKTKRGEVTNAIFGFSSMLLQVLGIFHPDYIVCALDSKGPTKRHEKFKEYKANRPKTDEGLVKQLIKISELIKTFKIPAISLNGYEADDIIGSIVNDPKYGDMDKIIVTGDRDLLQLLNGKVKVYLAGSSFSNSTLYDDNNVVGKLGFSHELLVDYKALRGDPSDNIPGVDGIGEKSATELVLSYGGIDEVYKNMDKIKPSIAKKLEAGKDMAYLSKELAQINNDLHIDIDLPIAEYADIDFNEGRKLFEYYEFRSLVGKLLKLSGSEKEVEGKASVDSKYDGIRVKDMDGVDAMLKEMEGVNEFVVYVGELGNIFERANNIYFAYDTKVFCLDINLIGDEGIGKLKEILRSGRYVTYNAKNLGHALENLGIIEYRFMDDLMLMDYLMNGGSVKIDLGASISRYLNIKGEQEEQAGLFQEEQGCAQSYHVLLLSRVLKPKFLNAVIKDKEPNIKTIYEYIEKPLVKVLVKIERNGINLDKNVLREFNTELIKRIGELELEIYAIAGDSFNISSPKQLAHVLFEKLKLPKGKKTKTGGYSTNERILNNYVNEYPIVSKILEYRELFKLRSTYTTTLIDQINKDTGRIHTSFNQSVVATGRLSSTNPNLQNIPTNTELGQKIRKAFRTKEGKMLISFDYSQQELRLLAHLSHEPKLVEAFVNNIDIHAATASQLYNVPVVKVTREQRRVGKTVNFGVIYGISAFGLADRLKIPTEEAQSFIDMFFSSYKRVKIFFEELKAEARNNGYIESILGRRRSALMLNSPNYQLRQAAEREIINFPLQASAADIMKLAMIKCYEIVEKRYSEYAKIVLQVHDELIFEVDEDDGDKLKEFLNEIKYIMVNAVKLYVPVIVDSKKGENWGELK